MTLKPAFTLEKPKPDLLIVDAGGTLFDPGSVVPVYAFQGSFKYTLAQDGKPYGIDVSFQTVMKYMGMGKREHVKSMLSEPLVIEQFQRRFGHTPTESDSQSIYASFIEQLYPLAPRNKEIPKVKEACFRLKEAGIPIVMTTGYDRRMINEIRKVLPWLDDLLLCSVAATDINRSRGRPAPFMIYRAMEEALVENPSYVVNVGDTEVDLLSADNAHVPGVLVTSGSIREADAERVNSKIGRKHLVAKDLAEVAGYVLDETLVDRIRELND